MRGSIRAIVEKYRGERRQLLAMLREVQRIYRCVPDEAITLLAEELDLPRVQVEGTATFYHFLSREHRGGVTIYLNTSVDVRPGRRPRGRCRLRGGGRHALRHHHRRPHHRAVHDVVHRHVRPGARGAHQRHPLHAPHARARARDRRRHLGPGARCSTCSGPLGDGRNAAAEIHSEVCNHIRQPGPVVLRAVHPGRGPDEGPRGRVARRDREREAFGSARTRRRRLLDRTEVGLVPRHRRRIALRDLQRGRGRARHLQGSGHPHRVRRADVRGHGRGRLRHRGQARSAVPARRVCVPRAAPREGAALDARTPPARPAHPRHALQLRHRHARGCRRLHLRRGIRADRVGGGQARARPATGRRSPRRPATGIARRS